jgi:Sigma-70 region 2
MRRDSGGIDGGFAAYVRERGDHQLRVAVLLTGDWHAAEDLVQASLVKLYRAWPRLDTSADLDAYLRRIMVNTHRSWWRARWRRETPAAVLPESASVPVPAGKSWLRLRVSPPGSGPAVATVFQLTGLGSTEVNLDQFDPQDLLALLESATSVREVGPASGAGWTGVAYAFSVSLRLHGTLHLFLRTSGTVDVDQQGRVRRLDATQTIGKTVAKVQMTFGDFGVRVSVSAPPAGQTFTP